jgi:hypothetical protein
MEFARSSPSPRTLPRSCPLPSKWLTVVIFAVAVLALAVGLAGCGGSSAVTPQADTTYTGPVQITGSASSGTISLVVSPDGSSIAYVSVTLNDLKTESFSAGSSTTGASTNIAIKDGSFDGSVGGLGEVEGRFTSATEAAGKVKLNLEIPFDGTADLGEFAWTAEAGEPGSSVVPEPPTEPVLPSAPQP